MKHPVKRFKSLTVALKELEPFIRSGRHLETGKPLRRFGGLRSRELVANWLLCVVYNFVAKADRLTFCSDPLGGDGIIWDTVTEEAWPMEHVLVPEVRGQKAQDIETLVLEKIKLKQAKGGAAYASGKTLVVFLNAGTGREWDPDKVAKHLPKPFDFEALWVVGLHTEEGGEYTYSVTEVDVSSGTSFTWLVRIGKDFDEWQITPIP